MNSSVGPDRDFHDDGALNASGHSRTWKDGTNVFELFRRLHIPADLEWRVVRRSRLSHCPARDTAWNSADCAPLDAVDDAEQAPTSRSRLRRDTRRSLYRGRLRL